VPDRPRGPAHVLPFDVWVVDNASTDGSLALLARDHPGVRVLRNDRNLGFAGGNDTALREVTTPYAVLLNNDATPEPDWLERLLAPFDAPGAERLAAVTSKVVFAPRFLPSAWTRRASSRAAPTCASSASGSPRSASTART
jgi:GT2 family glycosyltransferase